MESPRLFFLWKKQKTTDAEKLNTPDKSWREIRIVPVKKRKAGNKKSLSCTKNYCPRPRAFSFQPPISLFIFLFSGQILGEIFCKTAFKLLAGFLLLLYAIKIEVPVRTGKVAVKPKGQSCRYYMGLQKSEMIPLGHWDYRKVVGDYRVLPKRSAESSFGVSIGILEEF